MTLTTKITSKGQVTIPIAVRRELGVQAGERVVFSFSQPGEVIFRRAASSSASSRGILKGKTNGKIASAADIRRAATEGAARDHTK